MDTDAVTGGARPPPTVCPFEALEAIDGGVNDDTEGVFDLEPTADGGIDTSNTSNLYFEEKDIEDGLNIDNVNEDTNNNNNTHTKTVPDNDVAVLEVYPILSVQLLSLY